MPPPVDPRQLSNIGQKRTASAGSDSEETATAPHDPMAHLSANFGPPAEPGEVGTLGPYRVVRPLGRGGMGAVYAAFDARLNRRLALKVMLPQYAADPEAKGRFLREARAAAQVAHDNVVTVYEADERDGVPYIAMQFLEGCPLDVYLKRKGDPPVQHVLRIARQVAAGLAAAHRIGLVHRDIKPANLWLEAPHGRAKVLDFGLAKPVDTKVELTRSGAVVGTPAYMSPEQARGEKVDARTDLFSLGSVIYRLCTGRLPFGGPSTTAVLTALATEEPAPVRDLNPAVPEPLAALIHQLLSKDPGARPQSADDVVRRVRAITEDLAIPMAQAAVVPVAAAPTTLAALPETNPFADLDFTEAASLATERIGQPPTDADRPNRFRGVSRKVIWVLAAVCLALPGGVSLFLLTRGGGAAQKGAGPSGDRATGGLPAANGAFAVKTRTATSRPPPSDQSPKPPGEVELTTPGAVADFKFVMVPIERGLLGAKRKDETEARVVTTARQAGVDLGSPAHPLLAYSYAKGRLFYAFYMNVQDARGSQAYFIQRVRKEERLYVTADDQSPNTDVAFAVEAWKLQGGAFKRQEEHFASLVLSNNHRREVIKEFETGFGQIDGLATGVEWPFEHDLLNKQLQGYAPDRTLYDRVRFFQSRKWTLRVTFDLAGAYSIGSPELGFDAPRAMPDTDPK